MIISAARHAPGGFNAVSLKELDQPRHAAFGTEHTTGNVAWRILAAERANPQGNCVEMRIDANLNVLLCRHLFLPRILL
jgi:hypothetical protein